MNTKIIAVKDRYFTLFYRNKTDDFLSLKNELDIVSVRYFPKATESAKECRRLFEDCIPEILEEVKHVMADNKNFFQNFDVGMKFIANRSHYQDELLVDYTFYLDTRLKAIRN